MAFCNQHQFANAHEYQADQVRSSSKNRYSYLGIFLSPLLLAILGPYRNGPYKPCDPVRTGLALANQSPITAGRLGLPLIVGNLSRSATFMTSMPLPLATPDHITRKRE